MYYMYSLQYHRISKIELVKSLPDETAFYIPINHIYPVLFYPHTHTPHTHFHPPSPYIYSNNNTFSNIGSNLYFTFYEAIFSLCLSYISVDIHTHYEKLYIKAVHSQKDPKVHKDTHTRVQCALHILL